MKKFNNIEELLNYVQTFNGLKLKNFISQEILSKPSNKGKVGLLIEKHLFEIEQNNDANPDIENLGVDIKTTSYKILKNNEIRFKERIKIKSLNYNQEYEINNFKDSPLYNKIKKILLIVYIPDEEKQLKNFMLKDSFFIDFQLKKYLSDFKQIEEDWKIINTKIRNGLAHTISSKDTMYLEASTSGSGREQKAIVHTGETNLKQRSWSLKNSYLNELLKNDKFEKYVKNNEEVFSQKLKNDLDSIIGKDVSIVAKQLQIDYKEKKDNKSRYRFVIDKIISKLLKVINYKNLEEFHKSNLEIKVMISKGNQSQEHISFPSIIFNDEFGNNNTWENSSLKENIEKKFIIILIDTNNEKAKFSDWFEYSLSEDEIKSVKETWKNEQYRYLNNDYKITKKKNKKGYIQLNNFLKSKENKIVHLRPHTKVGVYNKNVTKKYVDYLLDGTKITKQSWWINKQNINKKK